MNTSTNILQNALVEADDMLFKAHCLLKRIEKLTKFEGFETTPTLSYEFHEEPHKNVDIDIFFTAKVNGEERKLSADDAIIIMRGRGKVLPSDFTNRLEK